MVSKVMKKRMLLLQQIYLETAIEVYEKNPDDEHRLFYVACNKNKNIYIL